VGFLGGIFAGILRLDLNEEPLKEWVTRTVEASDISEEETNAEESTTEAAPQEIDTSIQTYLSHSFVPFLYFIFVFTGIMKSSKWSFSPEILLSDPTKIGRVGTTS
jgi:hypothetical protein